MSKIKERIEEINKTAAKSRMINRVLWIAVLILGLGAIGLGFWADDQRGKAVAAKIEADSLKTLANEALAQIEINEAETRRKLDSMVASNVTDLWKQARTVNSLMAYSNYSKDHPNDTLHGNDLVKALDELLSNKGYVQIVERDGNRLYESVQLSLDGEFVKFKTDKSVRSGAIGIDGCGSSNSTRIGILLKDKIARIEEKCEEAGSKSVWAKIDYTK